MSIIALCETEKAVADANVTVSIRGLAVSSFNGANQTWETLFLRDVGTHELRISIRKCQNGMLIDETVYENVLSDERFEIRGKPAADLGTHQISGGKKGVENILNLSGTELYGANSDIFNTNSNRALTFLSISDSVFYAQNIPDEEYEIKVGEQVTAVRQSADITGNDIKCEGGKIEILTTLQPDLIPAIEVEPDYWYEIVFDNFCRTPPAAGQESDYVHYNNLFRSDVERSSVKVLGGGIKTGACHRAMASDLGSVNSLSDLLRPLP